MRMNSVAWPVLCGHNATGLPVWDGGDFGRCFEQLVLVGVSECILVIVSAAQLGRHASRQVRGPIPLSCTLVSRILVSLTITLASVIVPLLQRYVFNEHLSWSEIWAYTVTSFAWCIHTLFLWQHQRLFHVTLRGPTSLLVCVMVTSVSVIIQLHTVMVNLLHHTVHVSLVTLVYTCLLAACHLLYWACLIAKHRPPLQLRAPRLSVQSLDEHVDYLLGSGQPSRRNYGSIQIPGQTPHDDVTSCCEDNAGCLSRLTFWWVTPLMARGREQCLTDVDNLLPLPVRLYTSSLDRRFQNILKQRAAKTIHTPSTYSSTATPPDVAFSGYTSRRRQRSDASLQQPITNEDLPQKTSKASHLLVWSLSQCFGCEYYSIGILKLVADMLGFAGPLLLNLLVTYIEDSSEPVSHGYWYAAGLFASTFLTAILNAHFSYMVSIVGLKVRAALICTVYQKALSVSTVSLSRFSSGEVVNFMSTDTDRVINFTNSFHQFWSLPFQVAVSLYLLYRQLGLSFLAGLVFAILLIPVNRWIAIKIGSLSTTMMEHKDARVKLISEMLSGMRVLKLQAWEGVFNTKVDNIREKELTSLRGRKYLDALCVYFWATTPVLISILTFTTYALLGHRLTAAKVFTSLALFNMLISPLNAFPWVINGLMEAWVSIKRLGRFLSLPDTDWQQYYTQESSLKSNNVIEVQRADFSWGERRHEEGGNGPPEEGEARPAEGSQSQEQSSYNQIDDIAFRTCLSNLTFCVPRGSLVGVVGRVGAGKTSLLSALLGEMQRCEGALSVSGVAEGFGYVAQESWIQHGTVRENILFGRSLDQDFYQQVIHACALTHDLQVLAGGDQTEIGENGITLSGGQRTRIALARAVYQRKPVYLLDDPLAAVDAHVARHLFTHCIQGVLGGCTRILATHHVQYLRDADLVIRLEDGQVCVMGPPKHVLTQDEMQHCIPAEETQEQEESGPSSEEELSDTAGAEIQLVDVHSEAAGLVEEEGQESGAVRMAVYSTYWHAVGSCLAPAVLLSLLLMQASRNINDWWLSYWVTHSHDQGNTTLQYSQTLDGRAYYHSDYGVTSPVGVTSDWTNVTAAQDNVSFYLGVYAGLAVGNSIFTLARAFLFAYGGICAARLLHCQLLSSIMRAPISFFERTPIGRILNRFSSDLYTVDDSLPFMLNILLSQVFGVVGSLVVTCYGLPWFALTLPPLGALYYFIQGYYRQTSREIKRITSVTLSPIYAHFSESVSGLTTIRALRHATRFCEENVIRLSINQRAQYAGIAASQWLGIRLQMLGVAMVTGVAFIAVLEHRFKTVDPGLVGLAISYALSITSLLSGVVTSFTETEKQMVSVERMDEYINDIEHEKGNAILSAPPYWPIQGSVSFHRVCLRYRDGLPLALTNVTFETQPAEKIGIVGRTGSGKSSLLSTLFRLAEIESGEILIDGIGIKHIELQQLRSRLAIIPQDAFLFSGSVQENLDPAQDYTDTELWAVLHRCHLAPAVLSLGGLQAEVGEKGRRLSAGQRQLLCLARAMLTKAKVLCIDEATASVDRETDLLLQQAIRAEFRDNTVLTIAHRIQTVLDCDRVLVMDGGRVAEFDPPSVLLANRQSMFYSLVHGNNADNAAQQVKENTQ